jgi:hypothetical protein
MNKKFLTKALLITLGLILAAWFAFGFFEIQALFINTEIQDDLSIIKNKNTEVTTKNALTDETESKTVKIKSGKFQQGDSTYSINGNVLIDETKKALALSEFNVTNGPDLFVYLVKATTSTNESIKEAVDKNQYVIVDELKGNQGNQLYTLPNSVDINEYTHVSIWCKRFSRNFGFAELFANKINP